jgi:hypothetical protein
VEILDKLRQRYDQAADFGIIRYQEQVFLFTPPPPTAAERSTPSATHSPGKPGYHHFPPSAGTRTRQTSETP